MVTRIPALSEQSWASSVELLWLPLGAGDPLPTVRWGGRAYERLVAWRMHRQPQALFHAALRVRLGGTEYTIEMAPVWDHAEPGRGVVREGPVGLRVLGRSRWFRYAVRRWRDGRIPDEEHAIGGPVAVETSAAQVHRLLELSADFPTATWGRDEQGTGDMWNSNSLVAWLLVSSGHDVTGLGPPDGGRAPGWVAGLVVAGREHEPERRPVTSSV